MFVSWMFKGCFFDILSGYLINVLRVCPLARLFMLMFLGIQGCFDVVLEVCFEGVSRLFQRFLRVVLL